MKWNTKKYGVFLVYAPQLSSIFTACFPWNSNFHVLKIVYGDKRQMIFNKVAGLEKTTSFPVNFEKLLRTPFFLQHLQWLLLCNSTKHEWTQKHFLINIYYWFQNSCYAEQNHPYLLTTAQNHIYQLFPQWIYSVKSQHLFMWLLHWR